MRESFISLLGTSLSAPKCYTLSTFDDDVFEPTRSLQLKLNFTSLSLNDYLNILHPDCVTINITDNDGKIGKIVKSLLPV